MPYFVYRVHGDVSGGAASSSIGDLVRDAAGRRFELLDVFDRYQQARALARARRAEDAKAAAAGAAADAVRLVFAADQSEAEALLAEKREAPILREWEK